MMLMNCGKCGFSGDIDLFCRTPVLGQLPPGDHQCPNCNYAFRRSWSAVGCKIKLVQIGGKL